MKYIIKNKYWDIVEEYNLDKLLYLLVDRPTCISGNNFYWLNDKNEYHRDNDFPSYTGD